MVLLITCLLELFTDYTDIIDINIILTFIYQFIFLQPHIPLVQGPSHCDIALHLRQQKGFCTQAQHGHKTERWSLGKSRIRRVQCQGDQTTRSKPRYYESDRTTLVSHWGSLLPVLQLKRRHGPAGGKAKERLVSEGGLLLRKGGKWTESGKELGQGASVSPDRTKRHSDLQGRVGKGGEGGGGQHSCSPSVTCLKEIAGAGHAGVRECMGKH